MCRTARHPGGASFAPAEGLGDGFSRHGAPPESCGLERASLSLAAHRSAFDHSARTAKKPVTFSAICRASSQLTSRPRRERQSLRVGSIRLSFAAGDGFIRRPHGRIVAAVLLASGLGFPPMTLDLK